jgi:hypothetical protein
MTSPRRAVEQFPLAPTLFAYEEPAPTAPATPAAIHVVPVRALVRRVRGDAPPSGAERRDAALSAHEQHEAKALALAYVREKLAGLYQERVSAALFLREDQTVVGVTADDIDAILHRWPEYPRELRDLPGHWKGTVFRGGDWELTGQRIRSARAHMRATELPVWRVRDASARRSA